MRKLLVILLFTPVMLAAQTTEFGFFSLADVMDALPECKTAQDNYNELVALCDKEISLTEATLTSKYVAFIDGQNTFPEPILRKRQKELQEIVDRSVLLRDELKELLVHAHDSLFSPIVEKIDRAAENVCVRNNLAYAIDTDKAVYRFVNPNFGVDITDLIIGEIMSPATTEPSPLAPQKDAEVTEPSASDENNALQESEAQKTDNSAE